MKARISQYIGRLSSLSNGMLAIWAALLLAFMALILSVWSWSLAGDTPVYHQYANAIWHGSMPYRDIPIEYPPGVLPFILLAQPIGALFDSYQLGYLVLTIFAVAVLLWDRGRESGKKEILVICALLIPFLHFVFFQLDIFAALFLFGALRFIKLRRFNISAVLFALAILIKGYPLICLPAFLLALPRGKRRRFSTITGSTILVGLLPFLLISPSGVLHTVSYHTGRPLEFESAPAAVGFLLHILGAPISAFRSHSSVALDFAAAHALNILSSVFLILGFAGVLAFLSRLKTPNPALSCMALLLVFILTFKVGSPQFLVPLLLVSILGAKELPSHQRKPLFIRLLGIGLVVSTTLYMGYSWILGGLHWYGTMLIVLRIILEAELFVWVIRQLIFSASKTKRLTR